MITLTGKNGEWTLAWGFWQVKLPYKLASSLAKDLGVGKVFIGSQATVFMWRF